MNAESMSSEHDHAVRDRLMIHLQDLVTDAEALLKTAQRTGSDQFVAARDKFESRLQQARSQLEALQEDASYKLRKAARAADTTVHQHPYASAGVAAGIGLLVGMLISRR
jgi:ElaB/YqjD/DUF883 family membrane-anchored ribosome-binding protein